MPKKSLGDRYRAQSHKFFKLSLEHTKNNFENLQWAEQSARQSILYDYTNFQNWENLLKIKLKLADEGEHHSSESNVAKTVALQEKAIEKVNEAIKDGARLLTGGSVPENLDRGYFYQPTVLDNIKPNMEIITEEAFSPVLPIQKVSSIEEAIQSSNDSVYGLGCSIFTNDIDRALTAADDIKSGTVCINSPLMENIAAPFGGMKQSGIGREHGIEALDEFREAKHIYIDYEHSKKSRCITYVCWTNV